MPLSSERKVKRDLGIAFGRNDHTFRNLFLTPPHVEYTARDPRTAARLRRLTGTNVVELSNFAFMDKLERQTVRMYREDLQERMDERARQAAKAAHLELWESVLRGQSSIPPEQLDDPCMRQVRQHQLKIEALQQKAYKLGTSVNRIAASPSVWVERSHYRPPRRRAPTPTPAPAAAAPSGSHAAWGERHAQFASKPAMHAASAPSVVAGGDASASASAAAEGRSDSWRSRRLLLKWSDEARGRRSRSLPGHQYRRLTGHSELDDGHHRPVAEKLKKGVTICEELPHHRDRRLSRVNPPARPPVVFPEQAPRLQLLSCDTGGGRVVMRQLGSSDFIFPVYFRPRAPHLLRAAKDLSELYQLGNSLFDSAYPSVDNRDWNVVVSRRAAKKSEQSKQTQVIYPVKKFRLVK